MQARLCPLDEACLLCYIQPAAPFLRIEMHLSRSYSKYRYSQFKKNIYSQLPLLLHLISKRMSVSREDEPHDPLAICGGAPART